MIGWNTSSIAPPYHHLLKNKDLQNVTLVLDYQILQTVHKLEVPQFVLVFYIRSTWKNNETKICLSFFRLKRLNLLQQNGYLKGKKSSKVFP